MHPHEHAQQRSGPGQRQRHHGEVRPQQGQTDRQPGGQRGVVTRERPVPDFGAFPHNHALRKQSTARSLLVHHKLHRFAHRIGRYGAETGQYGSRDPSNIPALDCCPPSPDQQYPEDHKRGLGGRCQESVQPRRRFRQCAVHPKVRRHRSTAGYLDRVGLAEATRGQPGDNSCAHTQEARCAEQSTGPVFPSRFSFHEDRT